MAINDFLLTVNEHGLGYLTLPHEDLTVLEQYDAIRKTTIAQLKLTFLAQ